jgi:hypothetical protein
MQTVDEALNLLKRQATLETAMRQPGGVRVTEEQELHVVRRRLQEFPQASQAVIEAACPAAPRHRCHCGRSRTMGNDARLPLTLDRPCLPLV